MLSMRAKSLPLYAGMAAMALTVPGFSARAQQVAANQPTDEQVVMQKLKALQDDIAKTEADTARLKREGDAADARGAAADAEAAKGQLAIDCIKYLTAGVKSGAFDKAKIVEQAGGKLNVSNACPIAKDYGFGKKAEASPGLN
jgi:hypothetical protein